MKLRFFLFLGTFFLLFCSASRIASAQGIWEWQNPLPAGSTLNDVEILAPGVAVVAGNNATVMVTRDGGQNWRLAPFSGYDNFHSVAFLDERIGLVGGIGHIYRSGDGGDSWERTNIDGGEFYVDDIHVLDERNMAAVGGTIAPTHFALRSIDGGVTWQYGKTPDLGIALLGVYYPDSLRGWAVGSGGTILRTVDGGANWALHLNGDAGWGDVKLRAVAFGDEMTGLIAGENGTLLRTTDGGETWSRQELGLTQPFYDVRFITPDQVLVAGWGGIFRSEDGGETWARKEVGASLYSAALHDGWSVAVGLKGQVLTSGDGWKTWNSLTRSSVADRQFDVDFLDRDHGVSVGEFGFTAHTSDGGKTWVGNVSVGIPERLLKVVYAGPDTVYGLSEEGSFIRSVDAGKTWTVRTGLSNRTLKGIDFVDPRHGMIVGQGVILTTSDGGLSWRTDTASAWQILWCVGMADSQRATAAGRNGAIYRTTDGGLTWEFIETDYTVTFEYAQMPDRDNVILGHSKGIIRSTDGGTTWNAYDSPNGARFHEPSFIDPLTGWIAGELGIVYHTTDGGLTWNPLHHNVMNFDADAGAMYSLSFPDRTGGWVVGTWGTILHYRADENMSVEVEETPLYSSLPSLSLQPNPAAESIRIGLVDIPGTEWTVRLYNPLGEEMLSARINQANLAGEGYEVSVARLPEGFYYVDVRNERGEGRAGGVIVRR